MKKKGGIKKKFVMNFEDDGPSSEISSTSNQPIQLRKSVTKVKKPEMKKFALNQDMFSLAQNNVMNLQEEYGDHSGLKLPGSSQHQMFELNLREILQKNLDKPYFPLDICQKTLVSNLGNNTYTLNFEGIEQTTDVVFATLLMNSHNSYSHVKGINLTGCYRLTDIGAKWMAMCFPELTKVDLSGCCGITETGAQSVLTTCKNLTTLTLTGTGVHVMPHHDFMAAVAAPRPNGVEMVKVLVSGAPNCDQSLVKFLSGDTQRDRQPCVVKLKVDMGDKYSGNFIECDQTLLDLFITKRSVVLLPYGWADQDAKAIARELSRNVCQVFSKTYGAAFVLVGISNGSQSAVDVAKVKEELMLVLNEVKKNLEVVTKDLNEPKKLAGLKFMEQQTLANALNLLHSLEYVRFEMADVNLENSESKTKVFKAVQSATKLVISLLPEFQLLPPKVNSLIYSDSSDKLTGNSLTTTAYIPNSEKNLIEILSYFGKMMCFEIAAGEKGAVSVAYCADILSSALTQPPSGSVNDYRIANIEASCPVWTTDEIFTKLKSASKDEQEAKVAAVVFSKLGLTLAAKGATIALHLLPEDPPKDTIIPDTSIEEKNMINVSYKYIFPCLVGSFIVHRLSHIVNNYRQINNIWKNGFVVPNGIIEIVVFMKHGERSELNVVASMPIVNKKNEKELTKAHGYIYQLLETYKIYVDFVLKSNDIFYTKQIKMDINSKVPKPENVHGIVAHHKMSDSTHGAVACMHCGLTPHKCSQFLNIRRKTSSTAMEESFYKSGDIMTYNGNVFEFKKGIEMKVPLHSCEQNLLSIIPLSATIKDFTLNLRSPSCRVIFNLSKNTWGVTGGSVKDRKEAFTPPVAGEPMTFELTPTEDDASCCLSVYVQGKKVVSLAIPNNSYFVEIVRDSTSGKTQDNLKLMLYDMVEPVHGVNDIQVNMRLEAKDRLNPSLICVATVADINAKGDLLIHFDGWTNRYDYWADPSSEDLHPIGYMEAGSENSNANINRGLQIPKNYHSDKPFEWSSYCQEMKCLPVPFSVFNDKQKGKADELLTDSVMTACGEGVVASKYSEIEICSKSPYHYRAHEMEIIRSIHLSQSIQTFFSNNIKVFCFLPPQLSAHKINFFSIHDVVKNEQNFHLLCPGNKMEILHFVDHPGIPTSQLGAGFSTEDMASYLINCYTGLLIQGNLIPENSKNFVQGADNSSPDHRNLETKLKSMLYLYLLWAHEIQNGKPDALAVDLTKVFENHVNHLVENLGQVFDFTHGFKSTGINSCTAHAMAQSSGQQVKVLQVDVFSGAFQFIQKLDLSSNGLQTIPDNFIKNLTFLEELDLSNNELTAIPLGLGNTTKLLMLDVMKNKLTQLPADFASLKSTLVFLDISDNPFKTMPAVVWEMVNLTNLYASNIGKLSDWSDVKNLTALEELSLGSNIIDSVPEELGNLSLVYLNLSGVPWFPELSLGKSLPTFQTFQNILSTYTVFEAMIDQQEKEDLFKKIDKDSSGTLDKEEITEMNNLLYEMFPRFGSQKLPFADGCGIPPPIFKLSKLERLDLSFHGLLEVTNQIQELQHLQSLDISNNPYLQTVASVLGTMKIKEIHLKGCPSLKTPPKEVVSRGFNAVYGYLRRLDLGAVSCKRTKLMMVGLGGAGKTSLVRSLTNSRNYMAYTDYEEKITDGIDICDWKVPVSNSDSLTFSVWDFAGQTVYYNTHQFFLSNRAVYMLLWNIRLGYEHAGLDFWLSSIACHAPKAPVLVVGTHCDKVEHSKIPKEELKKKYPQIAEFFFVSSYSGENIPELKSFLVEKTLKEKYMGEQIPEAWLNLEKKVISERNTQQKDLVSFEEIRALGHQCGILEETELVEAVLFLHDLGSVQFFDTDFLRQHVVIYPQWIVNVMACVVTVHEGPIKNAKLKHKDMGVVWADYPKELYPWLLRLTEEFDLTFPMNEEDANLVPCLLPDQEPEFTWPAVSEDSGSKETKIVYEFKYLPAGLFNRAQTRLHQYAEGNMLWKKGMFMRKNNHIALMKQEGNMVTVKAQGFRPENIIFLVHEVFETLITQSYGGVQYDYQIPCIECSNMYLTDPSMFRQSRLQRAIELQAPFLQCEKLFHVLSIAELQNCLPPDRTSNLDNYIRRSVTELQDLGQQESTNVFFCFTGKNVPSVGQQDLVNPNDIMNDLRQKGFKVSYCENPELADLTALTLILKTVKVAIFGASDEFFEDESCCRIFSYIKKTLRMPFILVALGNSLKWYQSSSVAIEVSGEVFVKMDKKSRYGSKLPELEEAIKKKASSGAETEELPAVFISYCWSNSHDAIAKGSRKKDGALGWADPREVKEFLCEKKVSCWLDIERVGGGGLFEDIADGLKKAKVFVAFVSDEYSASTNCKMEFRFAISQLRIPTIIAVVGTGYEWERSEVGMLSVGQRCPKVNFQYQNDAAYLELYEQVMSALTSSSKSDAGEKSVKEKMSDAFREVLELSERQFLRHVSGFISGMAEYPRLIAIDMVPEKKDVRPLSQKYSDHQCETKESGICEICIQRAREDDTLSEASDKPKKVPVKYCYKLLCEHEEGWHPVSPSIPFPEFNSTDEEEEWLNVIAPYAVRLFAIIKYTNLNLDSLNTAEGRNLQERLQVLVASSNKSDFKDEYNELRENVMEIDAESIKGNLSRVHLPNGKVLWLCDEHRQECSSKTEKQYMSRAQTPGPKKPVELVPEMVSQEKPTSSARATTLSQKQKAAKSQQSLFKMRENQSTSQPGSAKQVKRTTSQACSVM